MNDRYGAEAVCVCVCACVNVCAYVGSCWTTKFLKVHTSKYGPVDVIIKILPLIGHLACCTCIPIVTV